jgi:hypothetical protein
MKTDGTEKANRTQTHLALTRQSGHGATKVLRTGGRYQRDQRNGEKTATDTHGLRQKQKAETLRDEQRKRVKVVGRLQGVDDDRNKAVDCGVKFI